MSDGTKRKRWIVAAALSCGVLITAAVFRVLVTPDERFEGEPLEFWLRGGQPPMQYLLKRTWSQKKAEEAVHRLGDDAIPILLRKLQAVDSPLKLRVMQIARKLHLVRFDTVPAGRLNIAGYEGFKILGTAGAPAIAELLRIAKAHRSLSSRCYSIGALGCLGPAATNAIPSLLNWLTDTNATIRWNSALTLSRIHANPGLVLPALIKLLDDGDPWVRRDAVNAIGAFGPEAVSAIPALSRHSEDPIVAEDVRDVLRRWYCVDIVGSIGRDQDHRIKLHYIAIIMGKTIRTFKRGIKAAVAGASSNGRFEAAGWRIVCRHCGSHVFERHPLLLTGDSPIFPYAVACCLCGQIQYFAKKPLEVGDAT